MELTTVSPCEEVYFCETDFWGMSKENYYLQSQGRRLPAFADPLGPFILGQGAYFNFNLLCYLNGRLAPVATAV